MKKLVFLNTVTPGAALLLLALMSLLPCANVSAQSVQSAKYLFTSRECELAVVRESAAGVPVISFYQGNTLPANAGVHVMYGDVSYNSMKGFVIQDTIAPNGMVIHRINDMRVVGDMCYFCGARVLLTNEYDPFTGQVVADSTGIIGRFRLNPSGFGQMANYDLKFISETKSLDRLAAFANNSDTVLAMIGIVNSPNSESCLTVASINGSHSWAYSVGYVNNSAVKEVFTDIAVDLKNVTVASYHKNSAGENYFNLRIANNSNIQNDMYTDFDMLNKYYPTSLLLPNPCYSLVRPNYAAVQLCATPNDSKVYAAYACSVNNTFAAYPTAMCEIETTSKQLQSAQVVQKSYPSAHTLLDMEYIDSPSGTGKPASVALLHRSNGMFQTIVEYPYANMSSYAYYVAPVQEMADNVISSVSAYNGDDIRFGGYWSPSSYKLTYIRELLPGLTEKERCVQNSDAEILTTNGPLVPVDEMSPLLPKTYEIMPFNWAHKVAATFTDYVETKCKY